MFIGNKVLNLPVPRLIVFHMKIKIVVASTLMLLELIMTLKLRTKFKKFIKTCLEKGMS